MPIYEYECQGCGNRFERLVRPSSTSESEMLTCPSCHGHDVQRLVSLFAVNSEGTKQTHLQQARKLGQKALRDQKNAESEQERTHNEDHHH